MGLLEAHAALSGKIAVVAGGAAGHIGRAVTLGLARAGVTVACCDNDAEGIAQIVPEVEALGGAIFAVEADVTDQAALDGFYDQVEARFPHVDILVNVAGGVKRRMFMETTREAHQRDIRLNYGYVIDSVQRCVPLIRKSGSGGSIINFTTIEAHRGAATFAVYAGAKAGLTNFSRAIAVELGKEQIRVNCIASDTSQARASNAALYDEDFERLAALSPTALDESIKFYVPQQRPPSVDDLINGLLFLASDMSRSITGTVLHIDGGTIASLGFLDWPVDSFMPAPLGGSLALLTRGEGHGE